MTKTQIRFRLERPLDEQTMPRIASAHSIYGIMRVQPSKQELVVDYDASRLRTEDVGAVLKRRGIPVELEK
jgi:allophanate hydrolase subunit 1